jgi:hypothetical protein
VAKALSPERCLARAIAFEECADHLLLYWTDVALEAEEGLKVERMLRAQAERYRDLAHAREQAGESSTAPKEAVDG